MFTRKNSKIQNIKDPSIFLGFDDITIIGDFNITNGFMFK